MILVDTSIWVDHIRREDPVLVDLLNRERVLCHPLIIGELAMGQIKDRRLVVGMLQTLPAALSARDDEVLRAIERYALFGTGLSYADASLLTSVKLTPDATVWTRDKHMIAAADRMSIAGDPRH